MDFAIVKRHPYVSGVVAIFAVIIIYLIMKRKSTAAASPDISGGDSTLAAVNAGQSLANAQTNAQITTAQIQGQVATTQIGAQLEAAKDTNATALSIVNAQTARDLAVEQSKDLSSVQIATVNANAATQISQNANNTALGIANLEASVENNKITTINSTIQTLGGQKQLGSKVIGLVEAIEGPASIAAGQPAQVAASNASAANGPAAILKAINPASIIGSLFGF